MRLIIITFACFSLSSAFCQKKLLKDSIVVLNNSIFQGKNEFLINSTKYTTNDLLCVLKQDFTLVDEAGKIESNIKIASFYSSAGITMLAFGAGLLLADYSDKNIIFGSAFLGSSFIGTSIIFKLKQRKLLINTIQLYNKNI
ncbi:MAG: hypothetical protein Tsb0034_10740 [Ekhidna sp.]